MTMSTAREVSGKKISWPEDEAIPATLKQAIEYGWELCGTARFDIDSLKKNMENFAEYGLTEWLRILLKKETKQFVLHVEIAVSMGVPDNAPYLVYAPHAQIKKPATSTEPVTERPKPEQLFDIAFIPPRRKVVRVLAEDENAACELASELFQTGESVQKPDAKRRPVFAWRQKRGGGLPRATRVKPPKPRSTSIAAAS